jgi:hypothetical protein
LELGLFEQRVVNASILTIVFAALLTSFGTQYFIKKMPAPEVSRGTIGEQVLIDVGSGHSDLGLLVRFAGRIARIDDGIGVPFVVTDRANKEKARALVLDAETAAGEAGYDYEGLVRLSESFTDGAVELIEEADATLAVLDWAGPGLGTDLLFGAEIDAVGRDSPIPTVAVHLTTPWERVIVVPGRGQVDWHTEDTDLVLAVAERLREDPDEPMLVIGNDENLMARHREMKADYEFVTAALPGDALVGLLRPNDLVVVPAYLLPEMALPRRLRLSSQLADRNLAIVAGPGRMAVTPRSLPHAMERILGPTQ